MTERLAMMIAMQLSLVLLAVDPTAAAAASAATQANANTPLREVVYKVSFTRQLNAKQDAYAGNVEDLSGNIHASPNFQEQQGTGGDSGTVTVDVMQVAGDQSLGLKVTERWDGSTPSSTYYGNVTPAGSVNFTDPQMTEGSRALLEYFGTQFLQGQEADAGISWTRARAGQGVSATCTYSIGTVEGAIADVHEQVILKSHSVAAMDTTMTADVQYKPLLLVPVSGHFEIRGSYQTVDAVTNIGVIVTFDRLSDSRDTEP